MSTAKDNESIFLFAGDSRNPGAPFESLYEASAINDNGQVLFIGQRTGGYPNIGYYRTEEGGEFTTIAEESNTFRVEGYADMNEDGLVALGAYFEDVNFDQTYSAIMTGDGGGGQFDGEQVKVDVTFVGGDVVLVGMHLLRRHRLEIDSPRRTVVLERIS